MLKRLKNIENKADNQLRAIEDQGNRQLALIGNYATEKINSIEFNKDSEEAKELFEKIKRAHESILKIKESKPGEPKFTDYGHGEADCFD